MTDTVGFPRWTQDVTFTSSGTWSEDYPVTNLGILPLARVARTATVEPPLTTFRGTLSKTRRVQILVLCRHNLTLGAKWRVRLFSNPDDVAPIFDSGLVDVWPAVLTEEEADWDAGTWWDRKYAAEDIAGYAWNAPMFIPNGLSGKAFEIELVDPTNPAGYLQIGLCEVASVLDFPISVAFGAQVGFNSRTSVTEADGGVEYFERRDKPRTFSGTIAAVLRTTALSKFYELQRLHDVNVPFFWWPSREVARDALRTAFLARMTQLDPLTQAYTKHDQISLNFKEIL